MLMHTLERFTPLGPAAIQKAIGRSQKKGLTIMQRSTCLALLYADASPVLLEEIVRNKYFQHRNIFELHIDPALQSLEQLWQLVSHIGMLCADLSIRNLDYPARSVAADPGE
jgi:hypothetical protein